MFHVLTVTIIWTFKMAFMFFYAAVYESTKTIKRNALYYIAFCFIPLSYVAVLLTTFLDCRPLSLTW